MWSKSLSIVVPGARIIVVLACLLLLRPGSSVAQEPLPNKLLFTIGAQGPIGQFQNPQDVAAGSDGTVYVTDTANDRVQYFSATGEFLGVWGAPGTNDGQFDSPQGIAVAPDGTVYVADNGHRIQRFAATGKFLGRWGAFGREEGQFIGPSGLAVAPDGTVYVADSFNHRIQHFSATGEVIGHWGSFGSGAGQFKFPGDVDIGPDGTVYLADSANHRVQKFSSAGGFIMMWGSHGSADGELDHPKGIATAPDGTVYVTDLNNDRVQEFSSSGEFLGKWGSEGDDAGEFSRPHGIGIAVDGGVYVTDDHHRVQRFDAAGDFLGQWGSRSNSDGEFNSRGDNLGPNAVAVSPDGMIYVADPVNRRIQRFGSDGVFLSKWGSPSSEEDQFRPTAIAVANDRTVYIADAWNYQLQHFSATGSLLEAWDLRTSEEIGYQDANDVALGPDGSIYVATSLQIQHFSADGEFLGSWGSQGSDDGQFLCPLSGPASIPLCGPHGVEVAADGTVYVADTWNHRIQYFTADGNFLGKWGVEGQADGELYGPTGIEMISDGTILVLDAGNNRLQHFSRTGEFLESLDRSSLEGVWSFLPSEMATTGDKKLYVTDPQSDRVWILGVDYPSMWRGEYFENRWLAGPVRAVTSTDRLEFDWGTSGPDTGLPADGFSARFTRYLLLDRDSYELTLEAEGGVRLWIDGQLLVDQWSGLEEAFATTLAVVPGYHPVRLEYNDLGGRASVRLSLNDEYRQYIPLVLVSSSKSN